jgi:hypothetical protein
VVAGEHVRAPHAGAGGRAVPGERVAAEVEGEAFTAPFSAPSAGPPPWQLYRFILHTAFGVASAEPYGATPLALRNAVNGPT